MTSQNKCDSLLFLVFFIFHSFFSQNEPWTARPLHASIVGRNYAIELDNAARGTKMYLQEQFDNFLTLGDRKIMLRNSWASCPGNAWIGAFWSLWTSELHPNAKITDLLLTCFLLKYGLADENPNCIRVDTSDSFDTFILRLSISEYLSSFRSLWISEQFSKTWMMENIPKSIVAK